MMLDWFSPDNSYVFTLGRMLMCWEKSVVTWLINHLQIVGVFLLCCVDITSLHSCLSEECVSSMMMLVKTQPRTRMIKMMMLPGQLLESTDVVRQGESVYTMITALGAVLLHRQSALLSLSLGNWFKLFPQSHLFSSGSTLLPPPVLSGSATVSTS